VRAAGFTIPQFEAELSKRLANYIKEPQVAVNVLEFRSQPVSVIGSVNTPGVKQLRGNKTLVEVLSLAGGLRQDAGNSVKITRRMEWGRIPLSKATDDPSGGFSVAEVTLRSIMGALNPEENIAVMPHDVISVPRADLVYVVGEVPKAGGFVLNERAHMTVLQALSMAGGLGPMAKGQEAKILRPNINNAGEKREEITVDLKKILGGKADDVPMRAEDILFIPNNAAKRASIRAAEAAIQTISGVVIWRAGRF
ncbi:MAG: SLBB domain-containing protein, partial [Bryobacteraceae bacterium]